MRELTENMEAEHWLSDLCDEAGTTHKGKSLSLASAVDALRVYHEHMTRWRPIDETPKLGQRIEVACKLRSADRSWSFVTTFGGAFEIEDGEDESVELTAWRPVGELPNTLHAKENR